VSDKELDNGTWVGNYPCVASEIPNKTDCNSSDALGVYLHNSEDKGLWYDGYCRSCNQFINSKDLHNSSIAGELGIDSKGEVNSKIKKKIKPKPEPITVKEAVALIKEMGYVSHNYRGIKDKYHQFYGHLTQLDSQNKVIAQYYPETNKGNIFGYKSRLHPKKFGYANHGRTGSDNDLSGQSKFKSGGKYILITGGELDKVAARQMLDENRNNKDYDAIAVVSPTTGETSAAKQIANNYEFLDQFDIIVLGFDNDEAGRQATKSAIEVLPADKVRIATWSMKDPNEMLLAGKERQFVRDFYAAKEYVDSGIRSSSNILDDVKGVLLAEKITLPKYMHRMESMMKRAFSKNGRVVCALGATSCGKSTHINNMVYHWMMEEGLKPLIISLEMTAGEYAVDLLSLHLEKNLDWFENGMDAWNYLEREDVKALYSDLFVNKYGEERFKIVDDRDGKLETLTKQIEKGVKQSGCNIVIIDVLSDITRFLSVDEQEKHMNWQKNFVKSGVSIVNVLHCKKPTRDKNGIPHKTTEFDVLGSGSFVQSAHINIIFNRDKMAEDPMERNRTYVDMPKCRRGTTGEAGSWIYDPLTRQVYDYEDFVNNKEKGISIDDQADEIENNNTSDKLPDF
jgi:archaellum biogenesis ATPase FlaH